MPELSIHSFQAPAGKAFPGQPIEPGAALAQWVNALMCWPNDEGKRKAYLALDHFRWLAVLELIPEIKADPMVAKTMEMYRESFGGWEGLSNLPPRDQIRADEKSRVARGNLAGGALCMAHLMHTNHSEQLEDGVSLRKVWAFLYRSGEEFFETPPQKEVFREAWDEFKPVAHFWAASFFMARWMRDPIAEVLEALKKAPPPPPSKPLAEMHVLNALATPLMRTLLPLAKEYQEFGLGFVPPHSRAPLLDAKTLWTLVDVPDWPIRRPTILLSGDMLETFNDF